MGSSVSFDTWHTVVVGVFAWSAVFVVLRKMIGNRSFDFCNRLVSMVHVGVAIWLSSASIKDWRHPLHPLASPSSPLQIRALAVSLSYFIYDFICCLFVTPISISNCIHHTVSILGLLGGISYGVCGSELVGCLWLMEISNPFMHMRELLKELNYKDSNLSLINDICFALIFSFARLIMGPYVTYYTLTANNPFIIKATSFGLQAVSIFWFYKIVRMVFYKLSNRNWKESKVS
ncbi:hypothetical protein SUGI_0347600 [Cryptomeria japonica]|uniref:uncharacterized protein LOC131056790 n=1 Tax=Cryptomeria japonica TaxID=3369 RepID=UPI002408D0F8|nr:uncharacterized protein LOC131056790 [Cryptomeria japonica]GLJ19308.1 hypothetical protein SUGI_0347600 [Cryptomeria japonica]